MANQETPAWDVKLLFDGQCPLCKREVDMLAKLNRKGRLALEDIAADGFDAGRYGLTFEQVMGHIHGVLPDGKVVTGMEAFRHAYSAVGLSALLAPTGWPGLRPLFDWGYNWFAKHRLTLTGRAHTCENGRCAVPAHKPAK